MVSAAKKAPAWKDRVSTTLGMPGPKPRAAGARMRGRPHPSAATPTTPVANAHHPMGWPASRMSDGASVMATVGHTATGPTSSSPGRKAPCTCRSPGSVNRNATATSGIIVANTSRQS